MGASHSVEATDTTVEDAIETPEPEVEPEPEPEDEDYDEKEMNWFWPII
jgi:hypothetical protein